MRVRPRSFAIPAVLLIVTVEHLPEPGCALTELGRTLKPGGKLLIAAPHEWETHQAPHDYFRYTRYGLHYLLAKAGFTAIEIEPVGRVPGHEDLMPHPYAYV